jgi:hypothetical protein
MPDALADVSEILAGLDRTVADAADVDADGRRPRIATGER